MRPTPKGDPLTWATGYPYFIPERSYVLTRGEAVNVNAPDDVPDLTHRHPVIACGSNQSPDRLAQKFGEDSDPIPVIRTRIRDFDSVYSAHFARYGSVPATLQYSPGTTVTLAVTWLTNDQLIAMNESEAENYHLYRLHRLTLTAEAGPSVDSAFAYISRWGCINDDGAPIALAAVPAESRGWPSLSQTDMLERARARTAPGQSLADFVAKNQEDAQTRQARADLLRRDTHPFAYDCFEKAGLP